MAQKYKRKLIHWGNEFDEEIEKFAKIIKVDKEMVDSIPENHKNKTISLGLFSHAIKQLIKSYNKANWKSYLEYQRKKEEENGNSNISS